jgi:hypothetical protein
VSDGVDRLLAPPIPSLDRGDGRLFQSRRRLVDATQSNDATDLGAADDLPGLAEDADRDTLVVDIETDVKHGCLLKSMELGTADTGFHVIRLTEASLIVSTPKRATSSLAASVDPTEARIII